MKAIKTIFNIIIVFITFILIVLNIIILYNRIILKKDFFDIGGYSIFIVISRKYGT